MDWLDSTSQESFDFRAARPAKPQAAEMQPLVFPRVEGTKVKIKKILSNATDLNDEISPSMAYHGKRVRLVRVEEEESLSVERHELQQRLGKEGLADALTFDDVLEGSVSVLFDDGMRLYCLLKEIEICEAPSAGAQTSHVQSTASEPVLARFAQASITHVSFPTSLAQLGLLVEGRETNMEELLWPRPDATGGEWTTPRWMTEGDILFFYHTLSASPRIKRLITEAEDSINIEWRGIENRDEVIVGLYDQLEIAKRYGGTIFACARISGSAHILSDEQFGESSKSHWKGRIHAPFSDVCVFARPIPDYAFGKIVPICRGAATTPVHGSAFAELKELIGKHNQLPDYLLNAKPGGVSFRDVDSTNWIEISCSPNARFIDESQLRAFLIDFLLEAIKDPRTNVYQECRCDHDDKRPSYADYCVRIHGRWIVVEAKLNVRAEPNLRGQISKYTNIGQFCPRKGTRAGEFVQGPTASTCLVIDSTGLYLMDRVGYVDCEAATPIWLLTQMSAEILPQIRERLRSLSET